MKAGQVFWGVLLITIGGLFLLDTFDVYVIEWDSLWRFWPVLIILWGISVLVGNRHVRAILAATAALILGILIYWFFSFGWLNWERPSRWAEDVEPLVLRESFTGEVSRARFHLETGAATVRIDDQTSDLIEAETRTSFGEYTLDKDLQGEEASFRLRLRDGEGNWNLGKLRNEALVHLHPDPVWDIDVDMGAASARLDLSKLLVENVRLETGATSVRLRLGDRAGHCDVSVKTGVSSIRIEVPETVGCRIRVEAPLSSKNFSGFRKVGRREYETDDYESASGTISITFDVGVSKLTVVRYGAGV